MPSRPFERLYRARATPLDVPGVGNAGLLSLVPPGPKHSLRDRNIPRNIGMNQGVPPRLIKPVEFTP